ncbi:type II secretion system protein [Pseudoalteromonas fenneropenaei]|uniref:Type II secretion system protein n=1 Tax=Pseudoalteromonas fenneropenaei TaxID=1737459 RepID=A0ABV7CKM4_9GAMM
MMFLYNSKVRGFSLIELLVVLSIISVVMSLTGGILIGSIEKQRQLVEVEQTKQIIKSLGYESYLTGRSVKVTLKDNEIIVHSPEPKVVKFESIYFVYLDILINSNGITQQRGFSVKLKSGVKNFEIKSIFDESSAK